MSGEHGLTIDSLVQATVVVANGDILTASASENPDLFFGIRGGGSNFGIVTEFVYKLHPQRRTVFAGPLIFPGDRIEDLAKGLDKWFAGASDKEGVHAVVTRAPDGNVCIFILREDDI